MATTVQGTATAMDVDSVSLLNWPLSSLTALRDVSETNRDSLHYLHN